MASEIIPDKVAKKLWLILGLISVSAIPALSLTTIDWSHWSTDVATQVGTTIVAWAGAIASLLGLSRYSPTTPTTTDSGN